jgi:predicted Zn-dependent peptidase
MGGDFLSAYRESLHKKVYPNGFTLLFQPVTHVASISCGLFLRRGSVHETESEAGYFHFVEHMLFKGTRNRNARQIVESIERVGGSINALTSREYTCYYISMIRDELSLALEILSDMIYQPLFRSGDMDLERNVILEEIKGYEDSPEDFLYDEYYSSFFRDAPIGRNIAGTKTSVASVSEKEIKRFYQKHYEPKNLILSISGNASITEVEELVENFFPISLSSNSQVPKQKSLEKTRADLSIIYSSPEYGVPSEKFYGKEFHKRKIEQVNFYMGADGKPRKDSLGPALVLACNILGGGMSSRLFQEVREKNGYCYGIQCFPSSYQKTGISSIFCATSVTNFPKSLGLILKEIKKILKRGFSNLELENSRTNLIGGLAMGYEMTESRMNNIAIQEIYFGKFYSLLDRIQLFAKVDLDELNQAFRDAFGLASFHLSAIGDIPKSVQKDIRSLMG